MRAITNAKKNQSIGVIPWLVVSVHALPDCRLFVRFVDGVEGVVDMAEFLRRECGVFKSLRNTEAFLSVHVDAGAVTWDNELDLAPDRMHAELQKSEIYVM